MTGLSTFTDYRIVINRMDAVRERAATSAQNERAINYFIDNIGKVTTGEDLIDDTRLYRFAMKAFGLESQIFAKGLMRKVFEEGVADDRSQANRMTDSRFRNIAAAFGFAEVGGKNTSDPQFVANVINQFIAEDVEVTQANDGVRLALYFERKAGGIDNWFEALADPALAEVVRVGLGFSKEAATQNIDRYAEKLADRFDVADFKDPEKVSEFLKKFAIRWDLENGLANPSGAARLSLFAPLAGGPTGAFGISDAALLAARGLG